VWPLSLPAVGGADGADGADTAKEVVCSAGAEATTNMNERTVL